MIDMHVGKLTAARRTGRGTGVARKLRQQGLVPAVLYGAGGESVALALSPAELHAALDPEKRENTLIALTIEATADAGAAAGGAAEQEQVLLKSYQVNQLSRAVTHVDFIRVRLDKPVRVRVPLVLEGRPEGLVLGGVLNQVFRELEVECPPDKIPARFVVDVSPLKVNDLFAVGQLALPEGVRVRMPAEQTLASVMVPRRGAETDAAAAGTAAEGAAEGGAAAPTAAAASSSPAKGGGKKAS
ncbi:MAG: 50S ribosomal protein L25 [Proteobacteria bacterium]|nr:50S ribosomal protein L25 [Pseudomonadota bacterium]